MYPTTNEEKAAVNTLCKQIEEEKDPERFQELVKELNNLFESNGDRQLKAS
jgi:hypothetical protein